jgi:hypothetical protein
MAKNAREMPAIISPTDAGRPVRSARPPKTRTSIRMMRSSPRVSSLISYAFSLSVRAEGELGALKAFQCRDAASFVPGVPFII